MLCLLPMLHVQHQYDASCLHSSGRQRQQLINGAGARSSRGPRRLLRQTEAQSQNASPRQARLQAAAALAAGAPSPYLVGRGRNAELPLLLRQLKVSSLHPPPGAVRSCLGFNWVSASAGALCCCRCRSQGCRGGRARLIYCRCCSFCLRPICCRCWLGNQLIGRVALICVCLRVPPQVFLEFYSRPPLIAGPQLQPPATCAVTCHAQQLRSMARAV